MKKTPEQRVETAVAAAALGFTTKVAKKDALEQLSRAYEQVAGESDASYWDRPSNLCHVRAKHATVFGKSWPQIEVLVELRKEINAIEVTKAAPKVDNTKVRELGPQAATTAGIDFIDLKGDRRGYCYCCGRVGFKLNAQGRLSRHGYSRPGWGYDVGGCYGSKKTPEQTLDIAIDWHRDEIKLREGLLSTDLIAFSIKQGRRQAKLQRAERRRHLTRGSYGRDAQARDYRNLRAGKPDTVSISGPAVWRRLLERELETHRSQLADLEAVKAGI